MDPQKQQGIEWCKSRLRDMMPCDAVCRAQHLSVRSQNPENEAELKTLIDLYFDKQPYHAGLRECLAHFWPNVGPAAAKSNGPVAVGRQPSLTQQVSDLMILTFTSWQWSIDALLEDAGVDDKQLRVLQLVNFKRERARTSREPPVPLFL